VVDLDKNKAKLLIIEQEFRAAEREEYARLHEQEEMKACQTIDRHSRYHLLCCCGTEAHGDATTNGRRNCQAKCSGRTYSSSVR